MVNWIARLFTKLLFEFFPGELLRVHVGHCLVIMDRVANVFVFVFDFTGHVANDTGCFINTVPL